MKTEKDEDGNPYHEATGLADGKYVIRGYFQLDGPGIGELEIVDGKDVTEVIKLPVRSMHCLTPTWTSPFTTDKARMFGRRSMWCPRKRLTVRQGDFAGRQRLVRCQRDQPFK